MKTNNHTRSILFTLFLLSFLISCNSKKEIDPLNRYKLAKTPVKLYPDEVSIDGMQWNNAFSKNNQELFYCQQLPNRAQLVSQKFNGKHFEAPIAIPFDTTYMYSDPYINQKANHLIFMSNKPYEISKDSSTQGFQLWQSFKRNKKWNDPEIVFTTETGVGYPSRASDGTLFFSLQPKDGTRNSNIHYAEYRDNNYQEPIKLPSTINSVDNFEGDAFIAPDKSYIIFASFDRSDNLGFSDMYISFNLGSNKWSSSKSLGTDINSKGYDGSPQVSEDQQYLIFTSSRNSPGDNSFFNHYIVRFDADKYR